MYHRGRAARDSYAISLRAVFIMAACFTFLAYLARLPVRASSIRPCIQPLNTMIQIPDKTLDSGRPRGRSINGDSQPPQTASLENPLEVSEEPEDASDAFPDDEHDEQEDVPPIRPHTFPRRRRLSTYESSDGVQDLEDPEIGGSARPESVLHKSMNSPRISR